MEVADRLNGIFSPMGRVVVSAEVLRETSKAMSTIHEDYYFLWWSGSVALIVYMMQ